MNEQPVIKEPSPPARGILFQLCQAAWLLLILSLLTSPGPLSAQAIVPSPFLPADVKEAGWPAVRGLHFRAHSPEIHIADTWPAAGPPVLWVKELGQGYSAFVARGNRVYTQGQNLQGQYVYCLDARSGTEIWKHWYDWPYELAG
ncbi:MAG TPA: hypothetical protein DCY03_03870, partial [Planctomycetaceae bacterium]|nr:hypothetical protein [Planctomycetaceae bacterium]